MDMICLSETYLESTIQSDNYNLEIPGYNLVYSDYPSNNKRGGVLHILQSIAACQSHRYRFLQEWTTFKVMIGNKQ